MNSVKSVGLMLVVFTIILFGVHKADTNTQDRINANTHRAQVLAYNICVARNAAIVKSNTRWNNEKDAWTAAAEARRGGAKLDTDPAKKKLDLKAAAVYERVANSITPTPQTPCGSKP